MDEKSLLKAAKCKSLTDVKHLSLANQDISSLDEEILSKLTNLESLDVSGNRLRSIPQVSLPNLKILNCEDNMIRDVAFLQSFPSVEQLFLTGNPLSHADRYIAVAVLPKLKSLDGKNCNKMKEINDRVEERLQSQVAHIWENNFSEDIKQYMTEEDIEVLQKQFLRKLNHSSLPCHEVPIKFKKYKVELIAMDILNKALKKMKVDCSSTNVLSPRKTAFASPKQKSHKESPSKNSLSTKHRSPLPASKEFSVWSSPSPNKKTKVTIYARKSFPKIINDKMTAFSPFSNVGTSDNNNSPSKTTSENCRKTTAEDSESSLSSTTTPSKRKKNMKDCSPGTSSDVSISTTDNEMEANSVRSCSKKLFNAADLGNSSPTKMRDIFSLLEQNEASILDFSPQIFLRCHSKGNSPADNGTQVWKAVFEPDILNPGKTTTTVATCGGNIICLVDCSVGRVMKRYKHSKSNEELFALSWTIIEMGTSKQNRTTILAAGGQNKEIHLLHPSQLVCFHTFKAHSKAINSLLFHPSNPTWLFSGSEDKKIYLWDIGVPSCPDYNINCQKLLTLDPGLEVLHLLFSPSHKLLLGACSGSLLAWSLHGDSVPKTTSEPFINLKIPVEASPKIIDGLVFVDDDCVASKVARSGKILLWSLGETLKKGSRLQKKSKTFPVVVKAEYQWSNCDANHIHLASSSGQMGHRLLACGDNEGQIWVYRVDSRVNMKNGNSVFMPACMLKWPDLQLELKDVSDVTDDDEPIIVNSVALNWNGTFLVACTDNNLVCVWKRL